MELVKLQLSLSLKFIKAFASKPLKQLDCPLSKT